MHHEVDISKAVQFRGGERLATSGRHIASAGFGVFPQPGMFGPVDLLSVEQLNNRACGRLQVQLDKASNNPAEIDREMVHLPDLEMEGRRYLGGLGAYRLDEQSLGHPGGRMVAAPIRGRTRRGVENAGWRDQLSLQV